jgi:hypothetical protein
MIPLFITLKSKSLVNQMLKFYWIMAIMVSITVIPSYAQHRVIISSDIGGTDDDDFQSLIHYLMYADRFKTEGLISSPYGKGRKEDIHKILDLYEKDYPKLKARSADFPPAEELKAVTKQGATEKATLKGWGKPTEGSEWIIKCARKEAEEPLYVLVWGGIEDVAQALHDAPDISSKLRVYWIGGPNKKWSADAYQYLVLNFPDLWIIETNSSYRGWFVDDESDSPLNVKNFYSHHIMGRGAMGKDFIHYYKGVLKMGDTPSVAYLLQGDPENPSGPSWGGSFAPLGHSSRRIFERSTDYSDTVPVFGLVEWVFEGPEQDKQSEHPWLWLEVGGQRFEGYYAGEGRYIVRFVPKETGKWSYKVFSPIEVLDRLEGSFVSVDPWPGKLHPQDFAPLNNWWSDVSNINNYEGNHQGAKTVYQWQKEFLGDWAKRWVWLGEL